MKGKDLFPRCGSGAGVSPCPLQRRVPRSAGAQPAAGRAALAAGLLACAGGATSQDLATVSSEPHLSGLPEASSRALLVWCCRARAAFGPAPGAGGSVGPRLAAPPTNSPGSVRQVRAGCSGENKYVF